MIFGWPMLSAPSGQFVTSTLTISGIGPSDVFGSAQINGFDILDWGSGWIVYTGYTNLNSYFVDRARARFPQMDVWPSCRFGRPKRSQVGLEFNRCTYASGIFFKRTETSVLF